MNDIKARLVTIGSIVISIGIVIGSVVLFGAVLLQKTIFSAAFYETATASENYIPMLKRAIGDDLAAQSSYVAIPAENLAAGLEDERLEISLQKHIQNTVGFLNFEEEFLKTDYPVELFYAPLEEFIQKEGVKSGFAPSDEQYDLLRDVSKDSSEIVANHVNILNMDLLKDVAAFKKVRRFIFDVSNLAWPAAGFVLFALAALAFLHRKNISRAVLFMFSSLWIFGSLLLIPAIVLETYGITRRLSIQTVYLKFAVDLWLTGMNRIILLTGLVLIIVSTVVLVARILAGRQKREII